MIQARIQSPPSSGVASLFAVLALLVAACASLPRAPNETTETSEPSVLSPSDRAALEEAERTLRRKDAELRAGQAGKGPDCPRACSLAAEVCLLAERICALTTRFPPDDPLASRCADARTRCARARSDTRTRCTCP